MRGVQDGAAEGQPLAVPKLVRWKYKLESAQTLKVSVWARGVIGGWETFYANIDKSGRITVPKLVQSLKSPEARLINGA